MFSGRVISKLGTHAAWRCQGSNLPYGRYPAPIFPFPVPCVCVSIFSMTCGRFPDGIHRCPECFHILALTPAGNIGKEYSEISNQSDFDNIGNAFCFYFFCCRSLKFLPHPLPPWSCNNAWLTSCTRFSWSEDYSYLLNCNILFCLMIIAFCFLLFHPADWHRRNVLQCFHKCVIKLYLPVSFDTSSSAIGSPSVWLTSNTVVTRNLGIMHLTISVFRLTVIDTSGSCYRSQSFNLLFHHGWCRCDDVDSFFPSFYMAVKLLLPRLIATSVASGFCMVIGRC